MEELLYSYKRSGLYEKAIIKKYCRYDDSLMCNNMNITATISLIFK